VPVSKPFRFKQFEVRQDRCAMKVGTDGVLLGAWTQCEVEPRRILDIGSGTGLIALITAQKFSEATIEAVEIDANAFAQCTENFTLSPWKNRLTAKHSDFKSFVSPHKFDLIVSNPPFYTEDSKSPETTRQMARSTASLSYEGLLKGVSALLSEAGLFSVIVPFKETDGFLSIALKFKLFPNQITHVRGQADKPFKRSMISFGFTEKTCKQDELAIELSRHQYTTEYIRLTGDFYLKMN
jgi:tRNA1Val (adenine37-N6)-methyltransferase